VAWSQARLFDTFIRRNIRLAEASSFGQTVFDYAPKSNGAADYAQLAIEVFGEAARFERCEAEGGGNGAVHSGPAARDHAAEVQREPKVRAGQPMTSTGQVERLGASEFQTDVPPGPAAARFASLGLPGSPRAVAGSWPPFP
jgi:hypothetical protein